MIVTRRHVASYGGHAYSPLVEWPSSTTSIDPPTVKGEQQRPASSSGCVHGLDDLLNPPRVVYGSGAVECDVWFRLYYDTDQQPVTDVRRVCVRFHNRHSYHHTTRTVATAIFLDDANHATQVLGYLWREQALRIVEDTCLNVIMWFTRRFAYKYCGFTGLPFPMSSYDSPLEAIVLAPRGWQPKKPWPPSKERCEVLRQYRLQMGQYLDVWWDTLTGRSKPGFNLFHDLLAKGDRCTVDGHKLTRAEVVENHGTDVSWPDAC
eukprot:jgi/Chlat1/9257/Chrsp99S08528